MMVVHVGSFDASFFGLRGSIEIVVERLHSELCAGG